VHELPDENGPVLDHQSQGAIERTQDHHGVAAFWPPIEFQDPRFLLINALAGVSYAPVGTGKSPVVLILDHGPHPQPKADVSISRPRRPIEMLIGKSASNTYPRCSIPEAAMKNGLSKG
jgi:hypothetical protein